MQTLSENQQDQQKICNWLAILPSEKYNVIFSEVLKIIVWTWNKKLLSQKICISDLSEIGQQSKSIVTKHRSIKWSISANTIWKPETITITEDQECAQKFCIAIQQKTR